MRWMTIQWTGVCVAVFSLLVGAAHMIGYSQAPITGMEMGFETCSLPCWAGIMPGITPMNTVNGQLEAFLTSLVEPPREVNANVFFTIVGETQTFEGIISSDMQGIVNHIRLNVVLSTQYLFQQLGQPDCSLYPDPVTAVTAIWQQRNITILTVLIPDRYGDIHPAGNTQFLDIQLEGIQCTQQETLPWLGFVPHWRYMAQLNSGR